MLGMDASALVSAVLAATGATPAPPPASAAPSAASPAPVPAAAPAPDRPPVQPGAARTVAGSIRVAHRSGGIAWGERVRFEEALSAAKRAARRLPPQRAAMVRAALVEAKRIAVQGRLNAERLEPVMKAVEATTHQARLLPLPAAGARLQTRGDGLVYEYRPRSGVQPHPLATAGRLNALALDCLDTKRRRPCDRDAVRRGADALASLGVRDAGLLRMEYTYAFGTGRPPWTSAMAQATAAQALARAARVTARRRDARAATAAFRALTAAGPAVRSGGRVERFAMYSFKPGMRVLNGELQALVGLADYARLSGSRAARRVARRTATALASELPAWDTGAWTLYAAGGREATLHYHRLTAGFAREACRRGLATGMCGAARRYARYTREPPRLSVRMTRVTRAGRQVAVGLRASKAAAGLVVVTGPRGVVARRALSLGRGPARIVFRTRRPGRYRVVVGATAVNGKRGTASASVRAKPKPKPKPKKGRKKKHR